jgi:hypothetical protein
MSISQVFSSTPYREDEKKMAFSPIPPSFSSPIPEPKQDRTPLTVTVGLARITGLATEAVLSEGNDKKRSRRGRPPALTLISEEGPSSQKTLFLDSFRYSESPSKKPVSEKTTCFTEYVGPQRERSFAQKDSLSKIKSSQTGGGASKTSSDLSQHPLLEHYGKSQEEKSRFEMNGQTYFVKKIVVSGKKNNVVTTQFNIKKGEAVASRVDHPTVVKTHFFVLEKLGLITCLNMDTATEQDIEKAKGSTIQAVACENIEGGDLSKIMISGPFPVKQALDLLVACAIPVSALNTQSIVHRDVKPENFMITREGIKNIQDGKSVGEKNIRIIDFGLSMGTGPVSRESPIKRMGTEKYIAPEVNYVGTRSYQEHISYQTSDSWALGIMLYEFLFGEKTEFDLLDGLVFNGDYDSKYKDTTVRTAALKNLLLKKKLELIEDKISPDKIIQDDQIDLMAELLSGLLDPDPKTRLTSEQLIKKYSSF